ncbi:hypothetical protein AZH53_08790 [Methanomicrobiaceae archaeon CYW5]|nr:hypothetical protein [Methanovulcanius yangii]
MPLLCGGASAYFISFTVPAELDAGDPLVVQGESNLPAGATVEVEIFRDVPNFQSKKITTLPATIREGGSWEVTFPTTGWMSGTYKVQLPANGDYPYGSSSVQLRTLVIHGTDPETPTASPVGTAFTPSPSASPGQTVKAVDLEPTESPAPIGAILMGLPLGGVWTAIRRRMR